jgi:tRNA(Ile)-lysidine synthase
MNKYSKGDVLFSPFGMKGHKTLRKFLIDNKIGTFERTFVEYVSIGDDILWIPGLRRSNIAPIDKNTSRVIIIKYVSD